MWTLILSFIFFMFPFGLMENQENIKTHLVNTASSQVANINTINKFKSECESIYIFQKIKFGTIICFDNNSFEKILKNGSLKSKTYQRYIKKINELLRDFQIKDFSKNKSHKIRIMYSEVNDNFFITQLNKPDAKSSGITYI